MAALKAIHISTVHYFSLDVEGFEMEVLKTIPFEDIDIKVRMGIVLSPMPDKNNTDFTHKSLIFSTLKGGEILASWAVNASVDFLVIHKGMERKRSYNFTFS